MIDLKVKHLFFDRAAVIAAVDRGRRTAMNRIGGFLRTTAKRSIRKRKGTSHPGKPPHSHVGLLRDHIYYSYDPARGTVVIGPALLTSRNPDAEPVDGTVPQVLEQGGKVRVTESKPKGRTRIVTIRPRPYMAPALDTARNADKLSPFWKDVVL